MATKSIDVELLAKMFLAGAQNIEAKKEYINELNVFPVPDGDTGTNIDRKSTRLNSSHSGQSRMPSSA